MVINGARYREDAQAIRRVIAAARPWEPVGPDTPVNTWLYTAREGERGVNLCMLLRIDGLDEWVEAGSGATTVTHHSFAAPTHYMVPLALPWEVG